MSDYKMVPVVATGELLKAVRDAMPSQLGHGWPTGDDDAQRAYARILAAAPPFLVTDEVVGAAVKAFWETRFDARLFVRDNGDPDIPAMRAAIEKVLGGGK